VAKLKPTVSVHCRRKLRDSGQQKQLRQERPNINQERPNINNDCVDFRFLPATCFRGSGKQAGLLALAMQPAPDIVFSRAQKASPWKLIPIQLRSSRVRSISLRSTIAVISVRLIGAENTRRNGARELVGDQYASLTSAETMRRPAAGLCRPQNRRRRAATRRDRERLLEGRLVRHVLGYDQETGRLASESRQGVITRRAGKRFPPF
jgi:hypothetical protein